MRTIHDIVKRWYKYRRWLNVDTWIHYKFLLYLIIVLLVSKSVPLLKRINKNELSTKALTRPIYQELSITLHRDNSHFHLRSERNLKDKNLETLCRLPQPVHLGPVSTHAANKLLSSNRDSTNLLDPIKTDLSTDLKHRGRVTLQIRRTEGRETWWKRVSC